VSIRLQDLRARAGSLPPYRLDLGLGVLLFAEAVLEGLLVDGPTGARLAVAGPAALVAAGIALRRRAPLVGVAAAVAGVATVGLLHESVQEGLSGIFFGWLFVTYSLAAHETGPRLLAGIALTVAGFVAAIATTGGDDDGSLTTYLGAGVLFIAGPLLAGRVLHNRVHLSRALRDKAAQAETQRRIRAEEAALDERARIAGELHDVVAHALGAMTIQAAAARRLATTDKARAGGAFEAVEQTGREALGEIRTLLDVLKAGDEEEPTLTPQPGLAALDDLVRRVRREGLPVDFEVHGTAPETMPTGVDLTAYRVVQEALSAALEQGGAGRAQVWVGYDDHEVNITIFDDGAQPSGRPLLGMRERVHLYGGEISAGPGRGGGHEVRARLPLESVHA
jgi:signal transduction histidine kinase